MTTKLHLEILWQLSPAGVAGVHGDKVPHGGVHGDLLPHEVEDLLLLPDGVLDALHLETESTSTSATSSSNAFQLLLKNE